jgi:uncharacterized RDD family membrane protein YckC
MTEQQPPAAEPESTESSTATPAQGGASTPPPASSGWAAPAAPTPVSGAAGLVYADVPNRVIAYIIDVVILVVINIIVGLVLFAIFGPPTDVSFTGGGIATSVNWLATIVYAVVGTAISAAYFIYTWTAMRGSVGQKVLSMQVGNATDGRTLTQEQAVKRWIFLGGPIGLIQALSPVGGIGILIGLLGLAYFIYLLWTTAQSPTKQGFHDVQAGTVVVKAARAVS